MPAHHPASATAVAPASVGNVAVGFDILGHALVAGSDRLTLRRIEEPTVRIASISGAEGLPYDPSANAATAGLLRLLEDLQLPFGFEAVIRKGIPLGSGMGGSAASAVASVVAANAFLPEPLTPRQLLPYALIGEAAASGASHGDNAAAALLGGMTLVRPVRPPEVIRIPVPEHIRCVLVHPQLRVETRAAREVLPREVALQDCVAQSANLAAFLAGCFKADLELIRRSLNDLVIEPHREPLVPGFRRVQQAALDAGALGCSLSGAGPSLFAWCMGEEAATRAHERMIAAFATEGIAANGWISPVQGAPGARVVGIA